MSSPTNDWKWSTDYNNYYRQEQDDRGGWNIIWRGSEQTPRSASGLSAQQSTLAQAQAAPNQYPGYNDYTTQGSPDSGYGGYEAYSPGSRSHSSGYGAQPAGYGTNPPIYGSNPTSSGGSPTSYGGYSAGYGGYQAPYGGNPTGYGSNPASYESNPASFGSNPAGYAGYQTAYGGTSIGYRSNSTGYGGNPTGYGQNQNYQQSVSQENRNHHLHQNPATGTKEPSTVEPPAQKVEAEIRGTHGETEPLDPTFFKRPDPGSFFVEGKVIAVLHTEGLGEDTRVDAQNLNVNITEVKHGERAYTNIRRFVVVHPRKGFCYACPISTYGNRATTKQGADQRAHGVIYTGRDPPRLKYGEAGIEKDPVRLIPSDRRIFLSPESRINYALCYPIQNNVKVKDLGRIAPEHLQKVAGYWRMEMDR